MKGFSASKFWLRWWAIDKRKELELEIGEEQSSSSSYFVGEAR